MALRVMAMAEMRLEVLLKAARSGETVTAVCRRHGISRETFYVYLRRFQAEDLLSDIYPEQGVRPVSGTNNQHSE